MSFHPAHEAQRDKILTPAARQEARLRFFRKRAMAAFRALDNACSSDPGYVGGSAIALAVSAQRKRNWYLGII